jgi:hypothetical protein
MQKFRQRPAYFTVHALRDGTIWLAVQGRRPSKKKCPHVDEDGIYKWRLDESDPGNFTESGKALRHLALVNLLNNKRLIRQQVEKKLDLILEKLTVIEQRLDRLEGHTANS